MKNLKIYCQTNTNFKFKITCLSETWCKDEGVNNNSLFQIPNYSTIHQIRSGDKKGGGVCMFLHNSLVYKLRLDLSINTIDNESLAVEIINKKRKNIIVHVLYRPPCGKIKPFKKYLKNTFLKNKSACLNVLDYKINKKIQNFFDQMFQHDESG